MIHKIASLQSHSKKTLAVILLGVALFRLPGLVIEFYDTDELAYSVWANEILDGATPYIDFIEQKPPVLNYLTAMVYSVAGENNLRALHFFTLIVVLFTCYYIYRISLLLLKSPPAAYFAMVAYGVFITAFDESFMAFNAEIIFQLPVAMACYYFVLYYFEKSEKNYHLMLSALYIVVAVMIKQQGGVILAAMGLYLLGLRPLLSWKNYSFSESFRICLWLGLWFTVFMAAAHGLMYLAGYLKEGVKWMWLFPFVYMKSSQSNIADLLGKYLSRQGALWAVQILLWASLGAFIHSLFRNKELSEEEKSKGQ
ncbi:MAG: glycosyltransferase family 39 protein, partial [Spirochaetota bacterium]|nr:glycosyltransferase family 39 protein [Spirochaetota bacterium]